MGFEKSLRQGCLGELLVREHLESQNWGRSIVDLRKDRQSQENDVDFLIENLTRQFVKLEVKTDFVGHKTGNIAYELTTSGNIGCFEKTKADWIAYLLAESRDLFILDVNKLKQFAKSGKYQIVNMGDYAKGYLIPIKDLRYNGVIIKEYKDIG